MDEFIKGNYACHTLTVLNHTDIKAVHDKAVGIYKPVKAMVSIQVGTLNGKATDIMAIMEAGEQEEQIFYKQARKISGVLCPARFTTSQVPAKLLKNTTKSLQTLIS